MRLLPRDLRRRPFVALFALGIVLRLALLPFGGYQNDLTIFAGWSHVLATHGAHALYATAYAPASPAINYPPGYALVLALVTFADRFVPAGPHAEPALKILLKLPAVIADVASALVAFAIVRRDRSVRDGLVAAGIALFGPWTWPISAFWGQVDSLCTFFVLLALGLVRSGRFPLAFAALAVAVLVKPFPALIAPALFLDEWRRGGISARSLAGPLAGLAVAYAAALPFAPSAAPVALFEWLLGVYRSGQSLFPETSINAYNLWTLVARPTSDLGTFGGLSLQTWGWLAFAIIAVTATTTLATRARDRDVTPSDLPTACFIVLAALFVCATRMHERYLIYALALAPLVWFAGRLQRTAIVIFTVTFASNVGLDQFYKHAHHPEILFATHVLSAANLSALGLSLASFLRLAPPRRAASPAVV